ncbi:hypothetical protein [Ornithinibacillus scapharcae]|uniref:hypothetical protein n=1 Tax=Ornithinibacillus scapharcae TaxID=1147159 RepID=UPI000225B088|nr:hypothetical protein [Ornithinibacillus scapharcae]
MEIELGGNTSLFLPPLHFTVIAIVVIFLLVKWSKQLETRRMTVWFYFLISTYATPIYSQSTSEGTFELWVPLGFIAVFVYMYSNKRSHPAKIKASIIGLCFALYQIIQHYWG